MSNTIDLPLPGLPGVLQMQMCSPTEFRSARAEFESKMRRFDPRAIAFLGKRALACMLGVTDVAFGRYGPGFAGTQPWVLPNPIGLNIGFSLDQLVDAYGELRRPFRYPYAERS